jgi:hypothetical protein
MPDWRVFVRERLGSLGLSPQREEEIRAELADHLEDQSHHTRRLATGIDWKSLARDIRSAEEDAMSHTAKTLWVPGIAGLLGATLMLFVMTSLVPPSTWVDEKPPVFRLAELLAPGEKTEPTWLAAKPPVLLLGIWMFSYLAFGGLCAYWSRRAGGSLAARLLSGVFPLALHLAVFVLPIFVTMLSADPRFPEHRDPAWLFRTALTWVLIPGVALAIGTLPFLRDAAEKAPPASA